MDPIDQILDRYSSPAYLLYNTTIPESDWGDRVTAASYLQKYYLFEEEYAKIWEPVQQTIFQNESIGLPAQMFKEGFSLLALRGGILFERADFEALQRCLRHIGDKSFVVVQNDFAGAVEYPLLRMKYPVDISWEELMSGNFVSTALLEMFTNEYFVYGESGNWGKYAANDYELPLDILGFIPEFAHVFRKQFDQTDEERREINSWLPPGYSARL